MMIIIQIIIHNVFISIQSNFNFFGKKIQIERQMQQRTRKDLNSFRIKIAKTQLTLAELWLTLKAGRKDAEEKFKTKNRAAIKDIVKQFAL